MAARVARGIVRLSHGYPGVGLHVRHGSQEGERLCLKSALTQAATGFTRRTVGPRVQPGRFESGIPAFALGATAGKPPESRVGVGYHTASEQDAAADGSSSASVRSRTIWCAAVLHGLAPGPPANPGSLYFAESHDRHHRRLCRRLRMSPPIVGSSSRPGEPILTAWRSANGRTRRMPHPSNEQRLFRPALRRCSARTARGVPPAWPSWRLDG
jgi:hypothetical protein